MHAWEPSLSGFPYCLSRFDIHGDILILTLCTHLRSMWSSSSVILTILLGGWGPVSPKDRKEGILQSGAHSGGSWSRSLPLFPVCVSPTTSYCLNVQGALAPLLLPFGVWLKTTFVDHVIASAFRTQIHRADSHTVNMTIFPKRTGSCHPEVHFSKLRGTCLEAWLGERWLEPLLWTERSKPSNI